MVSKLSQAIKTDIQAVRDTLPALQTNVGAIRKVLPTLQTNISAIRDVQTHEQQKAILDWLSPTGFPIQQHDIITRREAGTGQWFIDSPEFKRWLQGHDKT